MALAAGSGSGLGSGGRVGDMGRRLDRRMAQAGLAPADRACVVDRTTTLMTQRAAALGSEEHFETLHPARTLLILLDDCDVVDAALLEAAAAVESEHTALRDVRASALAARVPLPDRAGDALLEELVAADEPIRLIALAERLDHARHLHLRDRSVWTDFHHAIGAVYAPVATRTHDRLARRYDWWWHTFRRRFLALPDAP